jgi:glutaredoxin-related protein
MCSSKRLSLADEWCCHLSAGGSDICEQMMNSGELQQMLAKKA